MTTPVLVSHRYSQRQPTGRRFQDTLSARPNSGKPRVWVHTASLRCERGGAGKNKAARAWTRASGFLPPLACERLLTNHPAGYPRSVQSLPGIEAPSRPCSPLSPSLLIASCRSRAPPSAGLRKLFAAADRCRCFGWQGHRGRLLRIPRGLKRAASDPSVGKIPKSPPPSPPTFIVMAASTGLASAPPPRQAGMAPASLRQRTPNRPNHMSVSNLLNDEGPPQKLQRTGGDHDVHCSSSRTAIASFESDGRYAPPASPMGPPGVNLSEIQKTSNNNNAREPERTAPAVGERRSYVAGVLKITCETCQESFTCDSLLRYVRVLSSSSSSSSSSS